MRILGVQSRTSSSLLTPSPNCSCSDQRECGSLQEIILNPLLRDWIDTEISTAGYLTREKVRRATVLPLQVLGVGDLETLELLVELGKGTPVQLLLAALRDQFGKDQSFATWAWKRYPDVTQSRARLAYHAEQFETLTKRASAYYNP